MARRRLFDAREADVSFNLLKHVSAMALPIAGELDADPLLDRIGNARLVLLGEASHGTAEFYAWRRVLSERLLRERGFSFIAVEGDWPDCYRLNRYIKEFAESDGSAREALFAFERWPTWMWANEEVEWLLEWMHDENRSRPADQAIGFYGLDVYSLWESLQALLEYLRWHDGAAYRAARSAWECFEPFGQDEQAYAASTLWEEASCAPEVLDLLRKLRTHSAGRQRDAFKADGRETSFNAEQNALVLQNAERYYRTMVRGNAESWNVRDRHMMETLERLLDLHGRESKAIVWAHNTHLGDARYTDMIQEGMVNLGQLAREAYGEKDVVAVGFSTYRGTVTAGESWGAAMEEMTVPPGRVGSWEAVLHESLGRDSLLIFDKDSPEEMLKPRGHRAIGVVYRPTHEAYGNYVPTVLPQRYDALIYLEETEALRALPTRATVAEEVPETYPAGV